MNGTMHSETTAGLPPIGPLHDERPGAETCGICESKKTRHRNTQLLLCPHCDRIECKGPCPICQAGLKGLPPRPKEIEDL